MTALFYTDFHIADFIRVGIIVCFNTHTRYQYKIEKYILLIAHTFSYSRMNRSAFIDNVDIECNKVAVIAELIYDRVRSLAPGDAATLIN